MKPIKLLILVLLAFSTIFTSCKEAPIITTGEVIDIEPAQATFTGEVTSDGGATVTERGFVYSSKNSTPTIGEVATTKVPSDLGTGIGKYTSTIIDLAPTEKIYVRSYATNSVGTSYGVVKKFTTNDAYWENGIFLGVGVNIGELWWAPVNVGYTAENPYGLLFNWGVNKGFAYDDKDNATSISDGNWTFHDQGPCPDGWRVPTKAEYDNLLANTPITYSQLDHGESDVLSDNFRGQWQDAREENPDGLAGHWLGPNSTRATKNSPGEATFFPAAGKKYYSSHFYSRGRRGCYWSTTPDDGTTTIGSKLSFTIGFALSMRSDLSDGFGTDMSDGLSVRCVKN